jgi:hypothetical protein
MPPRILPPHLSKKDSPQRHKEHKGKSRKKGPRHTRPEPLSLIFLRVPLCSLCLCGESCFVSCQKARQAMPKKRVDRPSNAAEIRLTTPLSVSILSKVFGPPPVLTSAYSVSRRRNAGVPPDLGARLVPRVHEYVHPGLYFSRPKRAPRPETAPRPEPGRRLE